MPANRYRSLILSPAPVAARRHPALSAPCPPRPAATAVARQRSAHVISVVAAGARGWPPPSPPPPTPPSFFPYAYKYIYMYVRVYVYTYAYSEHSARRLHRDLTYVYAPPPSRARCGRACPRCRRQYRRHRSRFYPAPLRVPTTRPRGVCVTLYVYNARACVCVCIP